MAPQRPRILEESKSEVAGTKERQASTLLHKPRRNGNHGNLAVTSRSAHSKDITQAQPTAMTLDAEHDVNPELQEVSGTMNWPGLELSVLQAYRQAHRLNTPSSFSSSYNQRILCRQGIGWASPTMALHKDRRRVSKESLALAVRKDFKDAMVHESEAITCFLYSAQNQTKDFRMRFAPSRPK